MCEKEMSTQELFDYMIKKIIIKLDDGEITCPTCKGLRMIYTEQDKKGLIEGCIDCYNGKVFVCEYCGKINKTDSCKCEIAEGKRQVLQRKMMNEQDIDKFCKAKKINFADYKGKFISVESNFVKDSDEIEEWLYDKIKYDKLDNEELPKFLWATKAEPVFTLDISDIIHNECDDGYEDMDSFLDFESEDLSKAQEYLNKWYKAQGDSVNIYYEDYSVAILLDDLIKEIREDIKNGR